MVRDILLARYSWDQVVVGSVGAGSAVGGYVRGVSW